MKKTVVLTVAGLILVGLGTHRVLNYKYRIKNPPKGKNHAIIQLIGDRAEGKMGCSAFVISDDKAVTAAHCIQNDAASLKHKKQIMLEEIDKVEKQTRAGMKALAMVPSCDLQPMCSFQKATLVATLKLLKRERDHIATMHADVFIVRNIKGQDTGIRATAAYARHMPKDYAILTGNFKDFEKLPIKATFDIEIGDKLSSCGFAGSKVPPICTSFIAVSNEYHLFKGKGFFVKGMSGGPVIDADGFAVGIISRVDKDHVIMDVMVGIFDIVPPKEEE